MANHRNNARMAVNDAWMPNGTQSWWFAMSQYNGEVFEFLSQRFAKDSRVCRELSGCDRWSAVTDLHKRWFEEAMKDYSGEASKLMALYAKQSAEAAPGAVNPIR